MERISVILWIWLLFSGYWMPRLIRFRIAVWTVWLQLVVCVALTYYFSAGTLPVARMLSLIISLFLSVKTVVYLHSRFQLSFVKWCCFALLWVGMNPKVISPNRQLRQIPFTVLRTGLLNIGLGLILLWGVHWLMAFPNFYYPAWFLSLVGFSMVFHFGLINIMVFCWRIAGVNVVAPFRSPLLSKTLSAFWSKDWNYAFVEMNAIAIYRPLRHYVTEPEALILTFLVSGIFHEIAITCPVGYGFGGPLVYFACQGILVCLEKQFLFKFPKIMSAYGRLYLFLSLVLPLPLLFPPAFVHRVLFFVVDAVFG